MKFFTEQTHQNKQPIEHILLGLKRGKSGVIAGLGAAGKSFLALEIAIYYALKLTHPLISKTNQDRKSVMFITTEDDEDELIQRIEQILIHINKQKQANFEPKNLYPTLSIAFIENIAEIAAELNNLATTKTETDYDLIILDTFSTISTIENENDNREMTNQIQKINQIARQQKTALIFIHHLSQAGMTIKTSTDINMGLIRGATALVNNIRYAAILAKIGTDDKPEMIYKVVKANNAKQQQTLLNHDFWNLGFYKTEKTKDIHF